MTAEFRQDPLTGALAALAPGRAGRPHGTPGAACPFCPGPGEDTPPETWRLAAADGTWRVRAVRNRYPIADGHEVVIESPRHDWDLATATTDEAADLLSAWQHRHRALRPGAAQVVVYRNHGAAAGASLSHPHSQLVTLPVLAPATRLAITRQRDHYVRHGTPLAIDVAAHALRSGTRVVHADQHTTTFIPFAPTSGFELRIVPASPRADFADVPGDELVHVAEALRAALAALREALADPAYNLVVDTAPVGREDAAHLCWSLGVVPRLSTPAGLELATGVPVVTTAPEEAAARLRALHRMRAPAARG
ncbi:galactose-1-phosphate uridylyltransferase [Prauserella flavalba]|uniref:Galactose-1-phosphate uridylyltransferase n=1 Tax=Prauserella flavalba TaxID=1477506 RepID=A0A318LPN7_9PSEU|nr:DUF4931 domain-containing protein [Prauserella flavalba]PXY36516.1 galactose-1-phosphate uridylyltransferase [Prauserella flavalba]